MTKAKKRSLKLGSQKKSKGKPVTKKWFDYDCKTLRSSLKKLSNKKHRNPLDTETGADPGEVKWVNFHPPFSEPPSFFFFLSLKVALAKGSRGEPKPWSCLSTNCGNNKTV